MELRDLNVGALADRGWLAYDAVSVLTGADHAGKLDMRPGVVGTEVLEGNFEIFSVRAPTGPPYPWHEDWRFGHVWQPQAFRKFDFYTPAVRASPFDVKFPWELNRLGFLLAVAELAVIEESSPALDHLASVIEDWVAANPLGMSASWQPMEASMRVINLVSIVAVLERGGVLEQEIVSLLAPLIAQHAEFIWRTREFTDVRGNHYAANIVALLLCGELLRNNWKPAHRWFDFGREELEREVSLQFYDDGVNIEGSMAYHYLVTHFFLLGILAIERSTGERINNATDERIRRACAYLAAAICPNGRPPSVGDDDSAAAVTFNANRCPAAWDVLIAGACRWKAPELLSPGVRLTTGAIWTAGAAAAEIGWPMAPSVNSFYEDGGVAIARADETFFHLDVGDVGLRGRGGHGHNDLGSFELWVDGIPFVVDPGSYLYTGDLQARDLFRSSSYHNTVVVDAQEMAPLKSTWRIAPCAAPEEVNWKVDDHNVVTSFSHGGYERLTDPVRLRREVKLDLNSGGLLCLDDVVAEGHHEVERFLHLATGWTVEVELGVARCMYDDLTIEVGTDEQSRLRVEQGWVSRGYGRRTPAPVLIAASQTMGRARLSLSIEKSQSNSEVN